MLRKTPLPLQFLFYVFLCGMLFFSSMRFLLYMLLKDASHSIPTPVILHSFITGIQFDIVINAYILVIPFILFLLMAFIPKRITAFYKFIFYYFSVAYGFSFFILCADMPWFAHQQTRLTTSALQWTNTPEFMLKIIFEDKENYLYLFLFIVSILVFYFSLKQINDRISYLKITTPNRLVTIGTYLLFSLFLFFGIRGRIELKSPIRWGTAFTSEYNFTNQLGLNPVFSFVQSWIDERNPNNANLRLINDATAIQTVQEFYGITPGTFNYSPVERKVNIIGKEHRYNVVLVLMESMSSYNMRAFGNSKQLTPVLDDLFTKSHSFRNFYSDGIHTFCGVYSSLYGFPSLPNRHHLKDLKNQQPYSGLAKTLESKKYQTTFFTSHDEQFDNLGGFLSSNGFQKIFSQKEYSSDKILNTLGIPDHLLFEEAVIHINELSKNQNPFFVTVLTSSNHGPFQLPPGIAFSPKSPDLHSQLIEYADWSIGEFLKSCRQQPWFDSTLFLFTGDHGAIIGEMDMYLTFHRIPLIIYAPKIISPQIDESLGGQVDIYPTVMGLLNIPYLNNSFGIDLLKEKRNLISFTSDDELGAFSLTDFFVRRKGTDNLFQINKEAMYCKPLEEKSRKDSIHNFVASIMQTHQWIINNRRAGIKIKD